MTIIFELQNKKNDRQLVELQKKKITVTTHWNKFPIKTLTVKKQTKILVYLKEIRKVEYKL